MTGQGGRPTPIDLNGTTGQEVFAPPLVSAYGGQSRQQYARGSNFEQAIPGQGANQGGDGGGRRGGGGGGGRGDYGGRGGHRGRGDRGGRGGHGGLERRGLAMPQSSPLVQQTSRRGGAANTTTSMRDQDRAGRGDDDAGGNIERHKDGPPRETRRQRKARIRLQIAND